MFCQNCGSQVAQGAKFCNNCGAQVGAPAAAQPAAQPKTAAPRNAAEQPAGKKKKPNILLILIVVGICFIIGRAMGGSMADSYNDNSGSETLASSDGVEYAKIFSDRYIVTAPAFFGTLDAVAYASVDADGYIDHLQFGYQGDTIVQMVETVYIPVEGWSDEDKQALDSNCRANYAAAEALSFVSISYNIGYSYYSMTVTIRDLDQSENLQSAVSAGLLTLTDNSATVMSMSATEEGLLAQGYVKK